MSLDVHKTMANKDSPTWISQANQWPHIRECDDDPRNPEWRSQEAQGSNKGYFEATKQPTQNSPVPGQWPDRANIWPDGFDGFDEVPCQPGDFVTTILKDLKAEPWDGEPSLSCPHTEKAWVTGFSGPQADLCTCVFWKTVLKDRGSPHHWVSHYRDIFKIQH